VRVRGEGGRRRGGAQKRSGPKYYPDEALEMVKEKATARFDETVDAAIQLAVDPRKQGGNVRGVAELPHGTGKKEVIAVFARGDKAEEAKKAGADLVGLEELVERVLKGDIAFSKALATPDVMPVLSKVARVLGPRGLMPNVKVGTLTQDIAAAVAAARRGQVEFRVEKRGIVHAPFGKASFARDKLQDNLRALLLAIHNAKPDGVSGHFFRSAALSSTMGPGVLLDPATIDPTKPKFMAEKFKEIAAAEAAKNLGDEPDAAPRA
jgi:large subunit ribosomal protein L1